MFVINLARICTGYLFEIGQAIISLPREHLQRSTVHNSCQETYEGKSRFQKFRSTEFV